MAAAGARRMGGILGEQTNNGKRTTEKAHGKQKGEKV